MYLSRLYIKTYRSINELEEKVAIKIDDRADKTYWWYRNWNTKDGFCIAGWQKERFYPDFILTIRDESDTSFCEVNLLEPKGQHIGLSLNTEYKRNLARMYEQTEVKPPWKGQEELFEKKSKRVFVRFLDEDRWERKVNEMFA